MSLLRLKNIGKIYDSGNMLTIGIRGINLEFDYNEFVTIEGESGSGKSTLLNVIGANDSYEEGELYINDEETSHYGADEWEKYRQKYIATVFQDFNIIENLTVLENVELALLRIDDEKERKTVAESLIEKVGLTKQIHQRGSKLSGGEKQRTVIARALAKDAPIILADEPTGNLDVKSSREIAKLLKAISRDKLVIVVTHNPEFFVEYATRRVTIFDGGVKEDKVIEKQPKTEVKEIADKEKDNKKNIKDTFYIGFLNYKSRPKFTGMMSFALFICSITLFLVLSFFGVSMIQPLVTTLDNTGINGKVILSSSDNRITQDNLDIVAGKTNAGYFLLDRNLSEFSVTFPKHSTLGKEYTVNFIYDPYCYCPIANNAILVLSKSEENYAEALKDILLNADIGLKNIEVQTVVDMTDVKLYIGYDDLVTYGRKMQAINSTMKLGNDEVAVFTFEIGENIESGYVNLINSEYYAADGKQVVFGAKSNRAYTVLSSDEKNDKINGLVVRMNEDDYKEMFLSENFSVQSVLYYENNEAAKAAIKKFPDGYIGMLSTSKVYVQDAGEVFTNNVLWYLLLFAASLLFAMLITVIFMRSVKIYQSDFAVYRTLGISSKISACSLYVQMAFIFLPTLVLLPAVSIFFTLLPDSTLPLISMGNYIFIEMMLLLIVESVAFVFNRSINRQSIGKSLRRGSK